VVGGLREEIVAGIPGWYWFRQRQADRCQRLARMYVLRPAPWPADASGRSRPFHSEPLVLRVGRAGTVGSRPTPDTVPQAGLAVSVVPPFCALLGLSSSASTLPAPLDWGRCLAVDRDRCSNRRSSSLPGRWFGHRLLMAVTRRFSERRQMPAAYRQASQAGQISPAAESCIPCRGGSGMGVPRLGRGR
jgi:hypothetical protein